MFGGEADRVVVVGDGDLEAISRARVSLAVLLCCPNESCRKSYNFWAAGYRAAIEQGLVEVAIPPWHPQVKLNFLLKESLPKTKTNNCRPPTWGQCFPPHLSLMLLLVRSGSSTTGQAEEQPTSFCLCLCPSPLLEAMQKDLSKKVVLSCDFDMLPCHSKFVLSYENILVICL